MRDVDVIILSWNDGELLPKAIRSALKSASDGLDVCVTVVDNGSDEPPQLVDDPRVHLVANTENRGVAGGRNDGMAATSRPLACFLDSDAELRSGSLAKLVDAVTRDPTRGMTVPVFESQAAEASGGRAPSLAVKVRRMWSGADTYLGVPRSADDVEWAVDFGIGACQVFRREAFDSVGGLDERLWWADDVDFCLRLRSAGWSVVQLSGAPVFHPPRRRFTRPISVKGARHTAAVLRFLWRHRRYRSVVDRAS